MCPGVAGVWSATAFRKACWLTIASFMLSEGTQHPAEFPWFWLAACPAFPVIYAAAAIAPMLM